MTEPKRVAIVGSGCAGIGALWALKSTKHEVHLYEADSRLGGHTNTVKWKHWRKTTQVDTGFIVMNSATYPNFLAFLKEINIPTTNTEMTFGVSRDRGSFEWAGTSLSAVFAQKSNIFSLRVWRMLFDIIRFNQYALDLLVNSNESEDDPTRLNGSVDHGNSPQDQQSIGDYLRQEGYSEAFKNDYLIPMTASVWSTSPDKASLDFPAVTLVRFMWNHHLLTSLGARAPWMTIKGGTRQYIDAVMADFPPERVHLNTAVRALRTRDLRDQVALERGDGTVEIYDHVILATHGDTALKILKDEITVKEESILQEFKTSTNTAVLHSDLSLMPTRHVAWSAWNYITSSPTPDTSPQVCLTYWMNLLQHIPQSKYGPILVTLNPLYPPAASLTQGTWTYHHPLYNAAAIHSQKRLPYIQNTRGISYAGAWTKYGFHEDGFSSGVKVAMEHLGAELPFEFVDSTFSRGKKPVLGWKDYVVRAMVRVLHFFIVLTCKYLARIQRRIDERNYGELMKKVG